MRPGFIFAIGLVAACAYSTGAGAQSDCEKPLYLTLDTGHMEVAPLMADVLKRHSVRVTFFAANEGTKQGDGSMGTHWQAWWKERGTEGHEFASHTFDHAYWRSDAGLGFRIRPTAGPKKGQEMVWDALAYCAELDRASQRLYAMTGKPSLPLFRAPGGKTSPQLLAVAKACGYAHVGWSPAGFLGDELPSETYSNKSLLDKALRDIRVGDILVAHLGIWSRKDPWAPAVLEPLIVGLRAKGFCFQTLREHPDYRDWIAKR